MDIREIIAQGESSTVEFKSSLQWDVKAGRVNKSLRHSVLKTIAAFLNSDGGTLLIGVRDDGSIFGLEKDLELLRGSRDKFEQTFANLIRSNLGAQYAPLIKGHFEQVEGRTIYVVQVERSPDPAYLGGDKDKEFYVRMGTTTQALDVEEAHEYILRKWGRGVPSRGPSLQEVAMGRPFHTIAVPHDDISQGRLTLDVFAAKLGDVARGKGPEEYRDPESFFRRTYLTRGLKNLIEVVEKRLQGQGGDPVIQMQTPFGGGKTHALIALYHKAGEWGANTVVISGVDLEARDVMWRLMAEQLTGSAAGFDEFTAPGRNKLVNLLRDHRPVLVLIDEVLEYMVKAAGVIVGETTLADQTMAFLQELTEAAGSLERVVVVLTLPSSNLEHYGEKAERLFEQLKKVVGRVQKIFTPVEDDEVGAIIRRRLFTWVDEDAASQVIGAFIDQAEREALLARGDESASYRERFKKTYPFLPEVIDVLYHRWGGYPSFQRTRGTLRLLGLVVGALARSGKAYITVADFDLGNSEIRRELLSYAGNEYDSVLAADVVGEQAGARKADREIGDAYRGLNLGERVATTIFMYSFTGGKSEAGATLAEIKRQNLMSGVPSSIVADVLQKLNNRLLFYLHESDGRYYFSTRANLNRAITIRMANVTGEELREAELELLRKAAGGKRMATYIWPKDPADIPDNEAPKLLILREEDREAMRRFMEEKGRTPRVNRNTLFFLTPVPSEQVHFENLLRRHLAYQSLLDDEAISLSAEQKKRLKKDAKLLARDVDEQILNLYRRAHFPEHEGLKSSLLGTPTYGSGQKLDERVYEVLREGGRLLERLAPDALKERFLAGRDYVETLQLVQNGPRTPGEIMAVGRDVWKAAIAEGVEEGLFGLGVLDEDGRPQCIYFGRYPNVSLEGREVIIRAELCREETPEAPSGKGTNGDEQTPGGNGPTEPPSPDGVYNWLILRFRLPLGRASDLLGLINLLQDYFNSTHITIRVDEGEIGEADIEKIRETFRQIGTDVEIEYPQGEG